VRACTSTGPWREYPGTSCNWICSPPGPVAHPTLRQSTQSTAHTARPTITHQHPLPTITSLPFSVLRLHNYGFSPTYQIAKTHQRDTEDHIQSHSTIDDPRSTVPPSTTRTFPAARRTREDPPPAKATRVLSRSLQQQTLVTNRDDSEYQRRRPNPRAPYYHNARAHTEIAPADFSPPSVQS